MNARTTTLPAIGQTFAGGIFVGLILCNGQQRAVIASDKRGELRGAWGEYGKEIDGAGSANDGRANTAAMAAAGSTLAQQALALDIDGLTDWYIPSRDELELLYRHLKPTDQENDCSFRDGENPSAIPPSHAYTTESPAQTTVAGYREGEEHALADAWYWASTQYSADSAWIQDFDVGNQLNGHKTNDYRARAVRSVVIE